jgi:FixJ family two-component response regulator
MKTEKLRLFKEGDEALTGKKQIFVVDDDASVCRALAVLLATYGFSVDTFSSSDVFFNIVSDSTPGCLILDIHMPGLDGWCALERIIKSGSKRPVIIISADKKSGNHERALKAGAVGYLQKPFNDQALVGLINIAGNAKKEDDMRKVYLMILATAFLMTSILGCNALRGAGEDISNAGGHIQNVGN